MQKLADSISSCFYSDVHQMQLGRQASLLQPSEAQGQCQHCTRMAVPGGAVVTLFLFVIFAPFACAMVLKPCSVLEVIQ